MAIPFLNNIDLSDNQLLNAKLQITGTAPTTAAGQIYFDSNDTLAKYYSNATDTWVSLVQTDFANGTYVSLTNSGTSIKRVYTVDLSATGTKDATTYLRGDNTWAALADIYSWNLSANGGTAESVEDNETVDFIQGGTTTITRSGKDITISSADQFVGTLTGIGAGTYITIDNTTPAVPIVNVEGTEAATVSKLVARDSSGYGYVVTPASGDSSTKIATTAFVQSATTGLLEFKGGFNASTGAIVGGGNLTSGAARVAVEVGDYYVVTVAGDFFGNAATPLTPGDSVIVQTAAVAGASTEADFIVVQSDTDLATLTTVGIGNVNAGTGISVAYVSGTATVTNTDTNSSNTYADTITDSVSGTTFNHGLGDDVIVQLYDATTKETVYADVERNGDYLNITFAATPTNSVRVLVQKIG
ncbi:hypothetical protein N9Q05_01950 [bacterium]|nr:hypothetical protein [bacterium]